MRPSPAGLLRLLPAAVLLVLLLPAVRADGTLFEHTTGERSTRLWVPDDLAVVRGILIQGNPWGGDARYYVDSEALRGFAGLHGFVLLATAGWGRFLDDEILTWEEHLAALADLSGRPELVHAPWAPTGFSNGGQMSYGLNALRPEKVLGFVANKGGYYNDPLPPEPCLGTPGMLVAGAEDTEFRRGAIRGLFEENRARGALWAWVEEQGMGHQGDAERLLLPFLAECVRLRYPPDEEPSPGGGVTLLALDESTGWLVDPATWERPLTAIAPARVRSEAAGRMGWVPSADAAFCYRAFATRTDGLQVSGGQVLDRPLHLEIPEFGDYWTRPAGVAPASQTVRIDTSKHPGWIMVGFYSGSDLLGLLTGDGSPRPVAQAELVLEPGVHGLSALVTDQDGTVRTTGLRHRVVRSGLSPPGSLSGGRLVPAGR